MMNTRSKMITTVIATAALSTALFAGTTFAKDYDGEKQGKRGGPSIERIAEKLELSEAQTVAFTEIMEAQKEKRKALREELRDESRDVKKAQMETVKAETLESLSSILDESQLAEIETMMERGKKHQKGGKHKSSAQES